MSDFYAIVEEDCPVCGPVKTIQTIEDDNEFLNRCTECSAEWITGG